MPAVPTEGSGEPRRWPGIILSLFVPGFGLVRAGRPLRGLAWFVGLELLGLIVALLMITRLPTWVPGAGVLLSLAGFVTMLVDSFRPGRLTWRRTLGFVAALCLVAFVPSLAQLLASAFRVPTEAMAPTLGVSNGTADHVIVDRLTYRISAPKRGDLVVFRTHGIAGIAGNGDTLFVKRLVGLPGEKIEIRDGKLFADGKLLDENAGIPPFHYSPPKALTMLSPLSGSATYEVPPDTFFFLGDNSPNSYDSRYWGSVPRENIYGRVARIYYPWSRISVPR